MLKRLIGRQFQELFRGFFYNTKTNGTRSSLGTAALIILVLWAAGAGCVLMTVTAAALCEPLCAAGFNWLYFAVMGLMAVFVGIIGGIYSAFTSLYQAKDNDLLLAMPIQTRDIITARIVTVYLMGASLSLIVILPALFVYWIQQRIGLIGILGGIIYAGIITILALFFSCLLGYGVALISSKFKNRNLVPILTSLAGAGLYYLFSFKFRELMHELTTNPEAFARLEKVPGLKQFGQAGLPEWIPLLGLLTLSLLLMGLILWLLIRSFFKVISAIAVVKRVKYKEKKSRRRSPEQALLAKEGRRFAASPGYVLNAAMGSVFLLLLTGTIFWKGENLVSLLQSELSLPTEPLVVIACALVILLGGMNMVSTPSVSLEGKNIWLLQNLPVDPWQVLKAKLKLHMLVTGLPALAASLGLGIVLRPGPVEWLLLILVPQVHILLYDAFGLMMGLLRPNLHWTNELVPIKQSLSAFAVMMGSIFYGLALGVLYIGIGWLMGSIFFLLLAMVVAGLLAALCLIWLRTKGSARFGTLS